MKTPIHLITIIATGFLGAAAFADSAQQLLTEAQAAYLRGDLESAKRDFEVVRQLEPRNPTAIGYLRMIKAQEGKGAGNNQVEKQLAAVIIPQVQFREATFGSALDYLKQQVTKATNGKTAVNFVLQLPEETVKTKAVTLNLSNVPFTEVLRYLGGLADVTFTYDKYAIIVKPRTGATAATSTNPPSPARAPAQ